MRAGPIRRIVIVGGGSAGWMAAAPLAQRWLGTVGPRCEIELIETPEIATIGVGEATIPPIRLYNQTLGLDGAEFIRRTEASFKLGIEFTDWGCLGNRFFHGFGDYGPAIDKRSPHHHWLRLRRAGHDIGELSQWSMSTQMAAAHRFTPPVGEQPSAANAYSYAFHFDATLYAAFLRDYATARGVVRTIGRVVDVALDADDGFVNAVSLADGRRVEGDLFIDCSGFRGLLIEGALKTGYEDWSALLPCNSAWAVLSQRKGQQLKPFTTAAAKSAGWQWNIPLQHRTGNGHVYCSAFMSDGEAQQVLLDGLDAPPIDQPRQLRFTTGRRRQTWAKNVVAIGLAGGFIEPLESTGIHLIMDGVGRLIENFPDRDCHPVLQAEYNRKMERQYQSIRDFIVLHYKLTRRTDSEFWRYCAAMSIPDTLAHQIELFRSTGRISIYDRDSFTEPSWLAMFIGLGEQPAAYDPLADRIPESALLQHFARLRQAIQQTAAPMPSCAEFAASHGLLVSPNPSPSVPA